MNISHSVEIATFKLKSSASDAQLLQLEDRIRAGRISQMPGFISRELLKDEANEEWVMVMRFATREQMDAWMAAIKEVPEMRELAALIDMTTMSMRFFTHTSTAVPIDEKKTRGFVGEARFHLNPGVSEADFAAMEEPIRTILATQPGFLKRTLGKGTDGRMVVTIVWETKLRGAVWTDASKRFEVLQKQHAMIDFSSMDVYAYEQIL